MSTISWQADIATLSDVAFHVTNTWHHWSCGTVGGENNVFRNYLAMLSWRENGRHVPPRLYTIYGVNTSDSLTIILKLGNSIKIFCNSVNQIGTPK